MTEVQALVWQYRRGDIDFEAFQRAARLLGMTVSTILWIRERGQDRKDG